MNERVTIRSMTQDEYEAFYTRTLPEYAQERARADGTDPAQTLQNIEADMTRLLADGLETKDHRFYSVLDGSTVVGDLWVGTVGPESDRRLYIYDIWLEPEFRGRGIGTQVMSFAEDLARDLGCKAMGLHVFAHNPRAHDLYTALGYRDTGTSMIKRLT